LKKAKNKKREELKNDPKYAYVMSEPEMKDLLEKIKTRVTEEDKETRSLEIMS
jgi:anaerobic C4-dicarboxylate transporter